MIERLYEIDVHGGAAVGYHLDVVLTNRSEAPLTLYEHALPWVGALSIVLVAVRADAQGSVLDRALAPIDDPGPATVTVEPGGSVSGRTLLAPRFPGLTTALRTHDVVVFWTYRLEPVGGPPLARTGGYVVFAGPALPLRYAETTTGFSPVYNCRSAGKRRNG
jgi:hypothetical protein